MNKINFCVITCLLVLAVCDVFAQNSCVETMKKLKTLIGEEKLQEAEDLFRDVGECSGDPNQESEFYDLGSRLIYTNLNKVSDEILEYQLKAISHSSKARRFEFVQSYLWFLENDSKCEEAVKYIFEEINNNSSLQSNDTLISLLKSALICSYDYQGLSTYLLKFASKHDNLELYTLFMEWHVHIVDRKNEVLDFTEKLIEAWPLNQNYYFSYGDLCSKFNTNRAKMDSLLWVGIKKTDSDSLKIMLRNSLYVHEKVDELLSLYDYVLENDTLNHYVLEDDTLDFLGDTSLNVQFRKHRAKMLAYLGRNDEAMKDFELLIDWKVGIEEKYLLFALKEFHDKKEYAKVLKILHTDNMYSNFDFDQIRASSLLYSGDFDKAYPLLKSWQKLDPNNPFVPLGIAFIELQKGNYKESISSLSLVLDEEYSTPKQMLKDLNELMLESNQKKKCKKLNRILELYKDMSSSKISSNGLDSIKVIPNGNWGFDVEIITNCE